MTTKRLASLDLVLPVASHYRTDPQVLKDVEAMRTNAATRWVKDDYSHTLSGFHSTNHNSSKTGTLSRPKVETIRANSPTLKRLLAARVKLERYSNLIARTLSSSRQSTRSTRETSYSTFPEKQSSVVSQSIQAPSQPSQPPQPPPPPPSFPAKQIKSQTSLGNGPLDKITYEKTWSCNGNMKQKCSLEIWLPKAGPDDDDGNTTRTATPEINKIEKKLQPIPVIKSRRSSVVKITATTTITNIETKSLEEISSKKCEPVIVPHIYRYGDYIMDLPEERPRSSKSFTTVKSDNTSPIKNIRRKHSRRQSVSTNHSEEILRFGTVEVPTPVKNLSIHTISTSPNRDTKFTIKPSNPTMISELMQKYSLMKKTHQEFTQAKLQLEKLNNDSKNNFNTTKNHSPRSRPPPIPESTSLISNDQPAVSVKRLLLDTSPTRSITDHSNNITTKSFERRSTPRKPSRSDVYPQLRIFSLANQRQNRQTSASIPTTDLLPIVSGKKTDETYRTLQRSKTVDVVLDIPSPVKITSRVPTQLDNSSSNLFQRTPNGTIDQTSPRICKRATFTLRSEQQKQNNASIIQNSGQRSRHSPTGINIPTNKILINFNYDNNRNTDHNYVIPK